MIKIISMPSYSRSNKYILHLLRFSGSLRAGFLLSVFSISTHLRCCTSIFVSIISGFYLNFAVETLLAARSPHAMPTIIHYVVATAADNMAPSLISNANTHWLLVGLQTHCRFQIENTAVSITGCLLAELVDKKIKVIFCDEKRNPCAELTPYYGSHDTSIKIKKQIEWTSDLKGQVWTEIVSEKIRQQSKHLRFWECGTEADMLDNYIKGIEFNDQSNHEGHAAKVYFNALFGMEFTRTAEIPINAALNYGYGIILSAFNREICANGYLTQLGLFHDNMFNQFNLSSDLMEPFRPLIDKKVKIIAPAEFETEQKRELIEILNTKVTIDGKSQYLLNAVKIYCKSIFETLNQNDISLMKFYKNEL